MAVSYTHLDVYKRQQQRKSTDAPYFGYTMTIQNHSSYDVPFDNFDDKRIVVENADATDLGLSLIHIFVIIMDASSRQIIT